MTVATATKANAFLRFLDRLEDWARGGEAERMSAEEVRALARDIGLDAHDLERLSQMESDASRLLYKRLEGLGMSMAEIEASGVGAARDMERTCGLCADRALCAHDLAERPDSDAWRKVCPNNWTFDEVERRRAAGA